MSRYPLRIGKQDRPRECHEVQLLLPQRPHGIHPARSPGRRRTSTASAPAHSGCLPLQYTPAAHPRQRPRETTRASWVCMRRPVPTESPCCSDTPGAL